MAEIPYLVAIAASNKPTAAQAYEHGTTPVTGGRAPQVLVNGRKYIIHAFGADGNGNPDGNFEISRSTWNDAATDNFSGREIIASSAADAAVDWSTATGLDIAPIIRVVCPVESEGRRLHAVGTLSGDSSVLIGGSSNPFREGYDYRVEFENVAVSASSGFIQMRWSEDGVGVDSTGTDHGEGIWGAAGASGLSDANIGDTAHLLEPGNVGINNAEVIGFRLTILNPMAGGVIRFNGQSYLRFSGSRAHFRFTGTKGPGAFASDGVQFYISNANMSSGNYFCWEIPR